MSSGKSYVKDMQILIFFHRRLNGGLRFVMQKSISHMKANYHKFMQICFYETRELYNFNILGFFTFYFCVVGDFATSFYVYYFPRRSNIIYAFWKLVIFNLFKLFVYNTSQV